MRRGCAVLMMCLCLLLGGCGGRSQGVSPAIAFRASLVQAVLTPVPPESGLANQQPGDPCAPHPMRPRRMHAAEWRAKCLRPMLAAGPVCPIVPLFIFCFLQKIKVRIVSIGTPISPSRVILLGFYTRSPVLRKEYGADTVRSEIEIAVELRWVRDPSLFMVMASHSNISH